VKIKNNHFLMLLVLNVGKFFHVNYKLLFS